MTEKEKTELRHSGGGGEGVKDANINGQNQKEEEKQRQKGRRGEGKGEFGHHLFAKSTVNPKKLAELKQFEVISCMGF